MKQLRKIARDNGAEFEIREGGKHTVVTINGIGVTVPRHTEIGEGLAKSILKQGEQASE